MKLFWSKLKTPVKFDAHILFFLTILVLAVVLRFYKLGQIPVSLYWDEAALGYNAYSMATNLKDEYGTVLPLMFRSFGEYKMPAYIYLSAPVVKYFGLTEFTIRFWSAFLGVLAVIGSYLLTLSLFQSTKLKKNLSENTSQYIALITMFLLTISPWHIQFSRTGFEANGLLTSMIIGFWLMFCGFKHKWYFIFSAIVLGIGMYFYRGVIAFLPLVLGGAGLLYYRQLLSKHNRNVVLFSSVLFLLIAYPITRELFSSRGLERTEQVSVFNISNSQHVKSLLSKQVNSSVPFKEIIYNRRVGYMLDIVDGYARQLSPEFLFIRGDTNPRHNGSNSGVIYIWTIPFLFAGFVFLWMYSKKLFAFILLWILAAPIPAALSVPAPNALRSLNMLPMPEFLTAIGIVSIFYLISKKYRNLFLAALSVTASIFLGIYLFYYYKTWSKVSAEFWGDGYKQMLFYVLNNQNKYDRIIITGYYWQPYIYTLFYTKYNPIAYQKYGSNRGFDKFKFGGTSWDKDQYSKELDTVNLKKFGGGENMLIVLSPKEYEKQKGNIKRLKVIANENGDTVFIINKSL